MTDDWVRPYPPGTGRWLVIAWEAVALAFFAWAAVRHFDLVGHGLRALVLVIAGVWAIGTWRIVRHGVYVSTAGVRIRGLLRSRTIGWAEVAGVRLHHAKHRIGRWEIEAGATVLVERHDGEFVNTELWAQGVDFHARPKLFRAVYHELRNRHLASAR